MPTRRWAPPTLFAILCWLLASAAWAAVDLNTASPEELDTIKGIGPAKARAIVDYRRQHGAFRSVDDLVQVPGFGQKTVDRMRGELTVGRPAPAAAKPWGPTIPARPASPPLAAPRPAAPSAPPAAPPTLRPAPAHPPTAANPAMKPAAAPYPASPATAPRPAMPARPAPAAVTPRANPAAQPESGPAPARPRPAQPRLHAGKPASPPAP